MKKVTRYVLKLLGLYILTLLIWGRLMKLHSNDSNIENYNESYNKTTVSRYKSIPLIQSPILYDKHNISTYLHIIHESIRIIQLPNSLSTLITNKCNSLWRPKLPLIDHQHGVELIFPIILNDMSTAAKSGRCDIDPLWNANAMSKDHQPILYYIQSYVYHAVYCTDKKNNKEDWTKRDPYWLELATYITATTEWKDNMGIDFLIPASHPESTPSRHHPTALGFLKRASFLKTDFDVSGYDAKDVVVPYLSEKLTTDSNNRNRPILGFFAGGDNPKNGLRSMLSKAVQKYSARANNDNNDVIFTTDKIPNYLEKMMASKFCFIVRGDTSSSRRLFTAIAAGCIPVIISDWIVLPFAELIDYSKFTITFPESIVSNVDAMINRLLDISTNTKGYSEMVTSLKESRHYLLYDYVGDDDMKSIINPATLTLIEALVKRKEYCHKIASADDSLLCTLLRNTYL